MCVSVTDILSFVNSSNGISRRNYEKIKRPVRCVVKAPGVIVLDSSISPGQKTLVMRGATTWVAMEQWKGWGSKVWGAARGMNR